MNKKLKLKIAVIVTTIIAILLPLALISRVGSDNYYYLIKPLLWIFTSIVVTYVIRRESQIFNFNRRDIRELALIGSLIYIIIYFLMGLTIGYTKSPLSHSVLGILQNFWSIIPVAIAHELIRDYLFKTTNYKRKWFIIVYVTIFFILLDININSATFAFASGSAMLKFMYKEFIPSVVLNTFLSYLVYKEGVVSALLFKIPYLLVFLFTPVYLSNNYALLCAIQVIAPLIIYFKIEETCNHDNAYGITIKVTAWDRIKKILIFGFLLLGLSFTMGVLPYSPIIIASDSMYPLIKRGDIVVLQKTTLENVKIDDIIEYRLDKVSIIHRVFETKVDFNHGLVLITKGDNNQAVDHEYVTKEQVHGKIIMIVPKLGFPTLWFKELIQGKTGNVDIEMGEANAKKQ